ncbi:MAG: gliding motility lipoprotein GldH [Bacteroidota bacterium]
MLRYFPVLLLCLMVSACGPTIVYEKNYEIADAGWQYSDTLNFDFEIDDTLRIYNLWLKVAHQTNYRYQNLYTQVHTTFPSGDRISETLSLELANKSGQWQGQCATENCTIYIPIQEGAFFNQAGNYQLTLEQYMRVDSLPNINSIAFELEATGQNRKLD